MNFPINGLLMQSISLTRYFLDDLVTAKESPE